RCQSVLERSVLNRQRLIGANRIAECKALDPAFATHRHKVKMMCSEFSRGFAEPMDNVRSIREVNVAGLNQFVDGGSRCFQTADRSHDVDHGLCAHAWDCRATHMFDWPREPPS